MNKIYVVVVLFSCLHGGLQAMEEYDLHHAARVGAITIVKSLLDRGVNMNGGNNDGKTPLYVAAASGQRQVVEFLLDRGADPDSRNHYQLDRVESLGGDWQFHHQANIFEYIWYYSTLASIRNRHGLTPLFGAALNGHREIVELLLARGATVNVRNPDGTTPIHYASQKGHFPVVRLLLDHGADSNSNNKDGFTPLHEAAAFGHHEIAELLLAHGAVMKPSQNRRTLLWYAMDRNHPEVVKLLLVADQPKQRDQLHASQARIRALRCLCTFPKKRSGLFSCFSGEQPPLPPLPSDVQDLIISHLPEDITSPNLLARMLNTFPDSHQERVEDLVTHCPRALFVEALKKTSNKAMKRSVIAEITRQAIERASYLCSVEYEKLGRDSSGRRNPLLSGRCNPLLKQFIKPADPNGERAAFICQQIEKEFKKTTD